MKDERKNFLPAKLGIVNIASRLNNERQACAMLKSGRTVICFAANAYRTAWHRVMAHKHGVTDLAAINQLSRNRRNSGRRAVGPEDYAPVRCGEEANGESTGGAKAKW